MRLAPARRADRVLIMFLVAADLITVPVTFAVTWWLRTNILEGMLPEFHHGLRLYLYAVPVIAVLWFFAFAKAGLYVPRRVPGGMGEIQRMLRAFLILLVSMMAASYLAKAEYSRAMLFLFVGLAFPVSLALRTVAWKLARRAAPVNEVPRVLVVGTGEVAGRVVRVLRRLPGKPPEIVGVVSTVDGGEETFQGVPVVGGVESLEDAIRKLEVDEVFFAAPELPHSRAMAIISGVDDPGVHYRLVTDLFEIAMGITDLDDVARLPIIEIGYGRPGAAYRILKRCMDILMSAMLLLFFAPLMAVIYVIHSLTGKGSPIFRQKRVGLNGREFILYKFRTMKPDADEYEVAPLSDDDPRITRLGRFLRRTSLDELPQLINVLKGDMSMVGPRPEMPFIVNDYNSWQKRRLDVKPGLTGMWQIMGRKELPLHENLEYDYYYIRNQSLMLDFTILLRTIGVIFRGKGAY